MTYSSLKSAPIFLAEGIGEKSEFVHAEFEKIDNSNKYHLIDRYTANRKKYKIIGPALVCEELGVELRKRKSEYWHNWWFDKRKQNSSSPYHDKAPLEWMESGKETHAREQALRWWIKGRG